MKKRLFQCAGTEINSYERHNVMKSTPFSTITTFCVDFSDHGKLPTNWSRTAAPPTLHNNDMVTA